MIIAVSPYHLTTREPAAMGALLLAEQVVTMLPAPLQGTQWGDVRQAAQRVPKYLEFMQSWRWSMPLWQSGVIVSSLEGHEAIGQLRSVCDRIEAEERLTPLRSLMKPELFEDHERYLDALANDLLRAGPDPGITVPVIAGLDEFAARHSAAVARPEPTSVVQKAESASAEEVMSFAIPALMQGDAERIEEARELLSDELDALRVAIASVAAGDESGKKSIANPAREYARAFDRFRASLTEVRKEDDVRVVEGTVVVSGAWLPVDAALHASLSAMKTLSGGRVNTARTAAQDRGVFSLYFRALGRPVRK